jgi:hypothetical protein
MENKRIHRIIILLILGALGLLAMSGCSQGLTKGQVYPRMYEERPVTILALPPVNKTTSPVAKEYVLCTITEPLGSTGHNLLPIMVTNEVLKIEGLYDTEIIAPELYPRFKELFDVDALLFTEIFSWDTSYYVIGGDVTVGLSYKLVSTHTGEELWKYSGEKTVDTTRKSEGGGLLGLAVALVETAVTTAVTDYIPIARDINESIFQNVPEGKYSPRHGLDQDDPVSLDKN